MRDRAYVKAKRKAVPVALPEAAPTEAPPPAQPTWPTHWTRGQLLDLKRFTDGSYRATLLGEDYDAVKANGMDFDSSFAAQNFVSWWYQPAAGRWG